MTNTTVSGKTCQGEFVNYEDSNSRLVIRGLLHLSFCAGDTDWHPSDGIRLASARAVYMGISARTRERFAGILAGRSVRGQNSREGKDERADERRKVASGFPKTTFALRLAPPLLRELLDAELCCSLFRGYYGWQDWNVEHVRNSRAQRVDATDGQIVACTSVRCRYAGAYR